MCLPIHLLVSQKMEWPNPQTFWPLSSYVPIVFMFIHSPFHRPSTLHFDLPPFTFRTSQPPLSSLPVPYVLTRPHFLRLTYFYWPKFPHILKFHISSSLTNSIFTCFFPLAYPFRSDEGRKFPISSYIPPYVLTRPFFFRPTFLLSDPLIKQIHWY